jgi:hypothetical protein
MTKKELQAKRDAKLLAKYSNWTVLQKQAMLRKCNKKRRLYLEKLLGVTAAGLIFTPTPPTPPPPTKQKTNHVALLIDASGSMNIIREPTLKAINAQIKLLKEQAQATGQKTTATLVTFGTQSQVKQLYFKQPIDTLAPLTMNNYQPDGWTPLLDAVGMTIEDLARGDRGDIETSFLMVVITDGAENYSERWKVGLPEVLKEKQATDRWTFAFMVPQGHKHALVRDFGIPEGNVIEWEATTKGVQEVTRTLHASTQSYYQGRGQGMTSSSNFFTVNMSGVTPADVRRNCRNISTEVQIAAINGGRGRTIRDFCEEKFGRYGKGYAFYELVKPEKVQSYKKVIIRDRNNGEIYGGMDARHILGLPNRDIKVKPGDHGQFDLFVQSSSFNRILPQGTRLAFWPNN